MMIMYGLVLVALIIKGHSQELGQEGQQHGLIQEDYLVRDGRRLKQTSCKSFERIRFSSDSCNPSFQTCAGDDVGNDKEETEECCDVLPDNAPFECEEYAALGICDALESRDFCQKSCGWCCYDEYLPGTRDCRLIVEAGSCNAPGIVEKFCAESCGRCSAQNASNIGDEVPPPLPSRSPPQYTFPPPPSSPAPPPSPSEDTLPSPSSSNITQDSLTALLAAGVSPAPNANVTMNQSVADFQALVASIQNITNSTLSIGPLGPNQTFQNSSAPPVSSVVNVRGLIGSGGPVKSLDGPVLVPLDGVSSTSLLQFYNPCSECSASSAIDCDVDGLMAFKNSITTGEIYFESWIGNNPCTWRFVTCEQVDQGFQRVTALNLDPQFDQAYDTTTDLFANLQTIMDATYDLLMEYELLYALEGTLTPELSKLRYLQQIRIAQQNITGPIPSSWSTLTNLTVFDVYRIQVTGTLPTTFSTWKNLVNFASSFNRLFGSIPVEWSTWTKLATFYIAENSGRRLGGILPAQLSTWTSMLDIDLSSNAFSGSLPVEFSTWRECKSIQVADNQFMGVIPPQYSEMRGLQNFSGYSNQFTGSLPPEYSVMQDAILISIADNQLTGSLPPQYSQFTGLDTWQSFDNADISETVPVEWSTFRNSAPTFDV